MSTKMANPPVFYTIAQVKFNPVLEMQDFVGSIQKGWRSAYPDFSQDAVNEIQFHLPAPGRAPEVKTTSSPRWIFKTIDKTSCYSVGTNFLTFQTTAYQDSDHFIAALVQGLSDVHAIVKLAYIESMGMRMLDAIVGQNVEDLASHLKPNILGLAGQLDGECKQAISQLVMDTGDGQLLTAKLVLLKGRIGLPQELVPLPLTLSDKVLDIDGPHVILDNDCSQTKRVAIDVDDITKRFRVVKAQLSKAFLETVSEHAMNVWS